MDELLRALRAEAHKLEGSEVSIWLSKKSAELADHPDLDVLTAFVEEGDTSINAPDRVRVTNARMRTVIRRALARRDADRKARVYDNNSKFGMF